MASRKLNAKKCQIKRLSRRDEISSKTRCGYTPLPKPEPVTPVAEVPVVKPKKAPAPKLRAKFDTK